MQRDSKLGQFRDVPHFASKLAVENALRELGVPYTGKISNVLDAFPFRDAISDQGLRQLVRNNSVQQKKLVDIFKAFSSETGYRQDLIRWTVTVIQCPLLYRACRG